MYMCLVTCTCECCFLRERDEFQREIDTVRRALVEKEINERLHSEEKIKTQNEVQYIMYM